MGTVHIDAAATAAYLRSADGPVLRHTIKVAEAVKARTIQSLKHGFPQDFLGPTIVKRILSDSQRGPVVLVGSEHVKTEPHRIPSESSEGTLLVFDWPPPRGPGGVVYLRYVKHPGSDFTKYLIIKLNEALEEVRTVS